MKNRWKLLAAAIILALLLAGIPRLNTGIAEKTGWFNFIERDGDGVSFIISP